MLDTFKGDSSIFRVVMASSDPLETLHNINTGRYSIRTILELIEFLDVKETVEENTAKHVAATRDGNK